MKFFVLAARMHTVAARPMACTTTSYCGSTAQTSTLTYCNRPCGDRTWVTDSSVQRLNHWAIKAPERPSHLRLAGSLHYSPLFEIRAPWLGPLSTKAGSFHSQANPGYRCHQCNGPCEDRTRVADSRVQRLNHWAIKVPERPSRLRLAGSLHLQ